MVEVVGSSWLTSKLKVRFCTLAPVKAVAGIVPTICVTVSVVKSAAIEEAVYEMVAVAEVLGPLVELRETLKLKLELGSLDWLIEANSPSRLDLNTVVWAVKAREVNNIKLRSVATNRRFIGTSPSTLGIGKLD